jgi:hypothetical protein
MPCTLTEANFDDLLSSDSLFERPSGCLQKDTTMPNLTKATKTLPR